MWVSGRSAGVQRTASDIGSTPDSDFGLNSDFGFGFDSDFGFVDPDLDSDSE